MGAQTSKESLEEAGVVFVETEASVPRHGATSVLDELANVQLLAPILKESLADNTWKDLQALPKTLIDTLFASDASEALVSHCVGVYEAAARRVGDQQERVAVKLVTAEAAMGQLVDELNRYQAGTRAAHQGLQSVTGVVARVEELQARLRRATNQQQALKTMAARHVRRGPSA